MNLENIKQYIIVQAERWTGDEDGAEVVPLLLRALLTLTRLLSAAETSFSPKKTSFSPKKREAIDTRPAILARKSWTITMNRAAGTVTDLQLLVLFLFLFQFFL